MSERNPTLSDRSERHALLERLRRALDADVCYSLQFAADTDDLVCSEVVALGDEQIVEQLSALDGQHVIDPPWDPGFPGRDPDEFTRHKCPAPEPTLIPQVATACSPGCVARLLVYDGDELLGAIGVVRRGADARFGRGDLDKLASMRAELRDAWVRTVRAPFHAHKRPIVYLLRPDGSLHLAERSTVNWLDAHRTATVAAWVRTFEVGSEASSRRYLDGRALDFCRLDGDSGHVYQLRVSEPPRPRLSPLHPLTPTQRAVALLAAEGLTNRDIAASLGMSAETVKTHLKAVYRELYVSNRVELARTITRDPEES